MNKILLLLLSSILLSLNVFSQNQSVSLLPSYTNQSFFSLENGETSNLNKAILKAKMPKEVQKKCMAELKKLRNMSPMSAEATVVRNYLDWMIDIPWFKKDKVDIDLNKADPVTFTETTLKTEAPWTNISYQLYGTIDLWWIIYVNVKFEL